MLFGASNKTANWDNLQMSTWSATAFHFEYIWAENESVQVMSLALLTPVTLTRRYAVDFSMSINEYLAG